MLINFSLENFLSFSSRSRLSLEATSVREQQNAVFTPFNYEFDYKLLRSVVLYGYNSSGKSNLLKGIGLMKYAVLYSFGNPNNIFTQNALPFLLNEANEKLPIHFEISFFTNKKKYRYGFEILNGKVDSEWLYYAEPKIKENRLFYRKNGTLLSNKNWNKESDGMIESLFNLAKDNILFLSVLGQLNIKIATEIFKWFEKVIVVEHFDIDFFIDEAAKMLKEDVHRFNVLSLIRSAQLGFSNIKEEETDKKGNARFSQNFLSDMLKNEPTHSNYDVHTKHDVYGDKKEIKSTKYFNLRIHESTGTRKFFGLLGLLLDAIMNQKIILIDELDSRLHSILLENLLSFFNSSEFNPKGAQLILTSHNTYLLKDKKLRRDQIYLTEKNEFGESKLKRLHGEDANIRTDESIEKNYYEGKYSNTPKNQNNLFTGKLDFPDIE